MTTAMHKYKKVIFTSLLTVVMLLVVFACDGNSRDIQQGAIKTLADVKGKSVGVQLGTTSDILVSDMEQEDGVTHVERFTKSADGIQALLQGKVDCIITDEEPAIAFVEKNPSLRILPETFGESEIAICLAKDNTQLCEDINSAIRQLKAEGITDSIYNGFIRRHQTHVYTQRDDIKRDGILTFATNATFKPFEFHDKGEVVGIDIDIAKAICDLLGKKLKVVDMEFDAIITSVQTGKTDAGIAGIMVTPERQKSVLFTDEYATEKQVVIVNTGEVKESKQSLIEKFKWCFITDSRWQYMFRGLINTLIITAFAIILSLILGTSIAIVRSTHERNGNHRLLNALCQLYLTVVRGTPTMVQLLIIYYVVFASANIDKLLVAIIAFGLNSAAYIAEVVRSGIMSVDRGQIEAGRSLGLTYSQTMRLVVMPQAFKNVLPALGNELITLLKETSISGYIGLVDLTKGSDIIRSITYDAVLPLGAVALVYLCIVMLLTMGVNKLEKKLRRNER